MNTNFCRGTPSGTLGRPAVLVHDGPTTPAVGRGERRSVETSKVRYPLSSAHQSFSVTPQPTTSNRTPPSSAPHTHTSRTPSDLSSRSWTCPPVPRPPCPVTQRGPLSGTPKISTRTAVETWCKDDPDPPLTSGARTQRGPLPGRLCRSQRTSGEWTLARGREESCFI